VNTKYNNSVIRFIVGHQASGRTKLIAEKIITLKCFDAKEASNPNSNRANYGNNRYSQSNIDQWLNSAAGAGAWYSARHSYDAPPNNANVWSNYNDMTPSLASCPSSKKVSGMRSLTVRSGSRRIQSPTAEVMKT
jgi:hypothetical protein